MKSIVLASVVAAAASTEVPPPNTKMLFEHFKADYNKQYASTYSEEYRFKVFSENIKKIYASNAKNLTYVLGVSANTDRTFDEWRAEYLTGFKPVLTAERKDRPIFTAPKDFVQPDSVDWVAKGGVTSVKNQGTCGSCWTFSTVGGLEGAMFVAGRKMQDLSMQHILACDKGGDGCKGGQMDQAFDWVKENGVPSLEDEPYLCVDGTASECKNMQCGACTKRTGETCIFGSCKNVPDSVCNKNDGLIHHCECPADNCFEDGKCAAAKPETMVLAVGDVTGKTDVSPDDSGAALEAAVAQQPVSVAIEADQSVFQHYKSGVLTNDACGSTLDHGVLAVGYGTDKGVKYWKVKNSWGTVFGEDGYIRIERGDTTTSGGGGECGIRKMASFPTIKKATASEIVV